MKKIYNSQTYKIVVIKIKFILKLTILNYIVYCIPKMFYNVYPYSYTITIFLV